MDNSGKNTKSEGFGSLQQKAFPGTDEVFGGASSPVSVLHLHR